MFPEPPGQPSAEVCGLAVAAYGVLEVRDVEAEASDDEAVFRAGRRAPGPGRTSYFAGRTS